jgi:hypothetical protein
VRIDEVIEVLDVEVMVLLRWGRTVFMCQRDVSMRWKVITVITVITAGVCGRKNVPGVVSQPPPRLRRREKKDNPR